MMKMKTYASIDAVVKEAPKAMQPILRKLRATIHKAAPRAEEAIRYGMPVFRLHGKNLVYFMFFQKHIGFFAGRAGIEADIKAAKPYRSGRSALRFDPDKPIPYALVTKITKLRVKEVMKAKKN